MSLENYKDLNVNLSLLDHHVVDFLIDEAGVISESVRSRLSSSTSPDPTRLPLDASQIQRLRSICRRITTDSDLSFCLKDLHNEVDSTPALESSPSVQHALLSLHKLHLSDLLTQSRRNDAFFYIKSVYIPLVLKYRSADNIQDLKSITINLMTSSKSDSLFPSLSISSDAKRKEIASSIQSSFLTSLGGRLSKFGTIIRYLTGPVLQYYSIFNEQKITSTLSPDRISLIQSILLPEREPQVSKRPPNSAHNFSESGVSELVQALCITREEAIQALMLTEGDLCKALVGELSRFGLNYRIMNRLCCQYLMSRGLIRNDDVTGDVDIDFVMSSQVNWEQLRSLLTASDYQSTLSAINLINQSIDGFLSNHPDLHFSLLRQAVLLASKEVGGAVKATSMVKEKIVPIAKDKLPEVSGLMAEILGRKEFGLEQQEDLVSKLFPRISPSDEVDLVWLMQFLLQVHIEKCSESRSQDVFGPHLNLEDLISGQQQSIEDDCPFPQETVATLMDILGVSKSDAIETLVAHDGNLELVIESFFG
ncbi:hypothetical protein P9112_000024 [Eukaryota sp. TZLM1-RC]